MLVVLKPGTESSAIDEISQLVHATGRTTTVYPNSDGALILVSGDNAIDISELLLNHPCVQSTIDPEADSAPVTSNLRIAGIRPLVPPAILVEQLPLSSTSAELVHQSRG